MVNKWQFHIAVRFLYQKPRSLLQQRLKTFLGANTFIAFCCGCWNLETGWFKVHNFDSIHLLVQQNNVQVHDCEFENLFCHSKFFAIIIDDLYISIQIVSNSADLAASEL